MNKTKLLLLLGFLVLVVVGILSARMRMDHQERLAEYANHLKEGDLVFQKLDGDLSKAIRLATHSEYCHCGIIYKDSDKVYVYEAIGPVMFTPLKEWIDRGEGDEILVKRLKNADQVLTPETLEKLKKGGMRYYKKDYDIFFEWSDDRIYCSELLWKMYFTATGLEIGKLQKLRDFDLSSPLVKEEMKARYGDHIPYDEQVISPVSMMNSDLLVTVE